MSKWQICHLLVFWSQLKLNLSDWGKFYGVLNIRQRTTFPMKTLTPSFCIFKVKIQNLRENRKLPVKQGIWTVRGILVISQVTVFRLSWNFVGRYLAQFSTTFMFWARTDFVRTRKFSYLLNITSLLKYLFFYFLRIIYFDYLKYIYMERCLFYIFKAFCWKIHFSKTRLVQNNEYTFFEAIFESGVY